MIPSLVIDPVDSFSIIIFSVPSSNRRTCLDPIILTLLAFIVPVFSTSFAMRYTLLFKQFISPLFFILFSDSPINLSLLFK